MVQNQAAYIATYIASGGLCQIKQPNIPSEMLHPTHHLLHLYIATLHWLLLSPFKNHQMCSKRKILIVQ